MMMMMMMMMMTTMMMTVIIFYLENTGRDGELTILFSGIKDIFFAPCYLCILPIYNSNCNFEL